MPTLTSIVYKPIAANPYPEDRYLRVSVTEAQLVLGRGLEGDVKGRAATRQLNIMSAETLAQLQAEGYQTAPGQMGEQLVIAGLDVATLPSGARLQIGAEAQVEVLKLRTGCDRFQRIQGHAPAEAARRLGIIANVVAAGPIRVGDTVTVL
jgi:MOSC domain-containing protein YiiM